jgi:hypothetical protein
MRAGNVKNSHKWGGSGLETWIEGDTAFVSVVFSWLLQEAYQKAGFYKARGFHVQAGGPAVSINPGYLADVAEIGQQCDSALLRHNSNATFTSRGCPNKCPFCVVPKIEGDLVELKHWVPRPVVCDNNFLACSRKHFDTVIDRLKPLEYVDFNQGLDARLLTPYHANRLAELDLYCVRLAWDHTKLESQFMQAYETLLETGFIPRKIRVYVLIGYNDTPEDARYRLETVAKLGALPNPSRYQPLDTVRRNEHVAVGWTHNELVRLTRYFYNYYRVGSKIPYDDFQYPVKPQPKKRSAFQASLL